MVRLLAMSMALLHGVMFALALRSLTVHFECIALLHCLVCCGGVFSLVPTLTPHNCLGPYLLIGCGVWGPCPSCGKSMRKWGGKIFCRRGCSVDAQGEGK